MMNYDKEPLGQAEMDRLRTMFASGEMKELRRALECVMQAHSLDAINFKFQASVEDKNYQKLDLQAKGAEDDARRLAVFIRTLDTIIAGDYNLFHIRLKQ